MSNVVKGLKRDQSLQLAAVISLVLISFIVLIKVENMLISFILAFVISYLFNPIVSRMERGGLDRSLSIFFLFTFVGVLLGVGGTLLSPVVSEQFGTIQSEIPKYAEGITSLMAYIENKINTTLAGIYSVNFSENAGFIIQSWLGSFLASIPLLAQKTFTVLILAPFFAFFMLRDGRNISRRFLAMVPNNLFELALSLSHNINEQMGGFIRARLLEALIVGTVVWIGLAVIGFPYAVFLAVIAAATNLIPYVGPIIGAIPAFVTAFINNDPAITIVLVTAIYVTAQIIDIIFIIPMVVARIVNLHPVTVVVVIIIGSQVMGILGMIISIPLTSVIKLTVSTVYDHVVGFKVS
jgi:putative permease